MTTIVAQIANSFVFRVHKRVWAAAGHPHTVFSLSYEELLRITGGRAVEASAADATAALDGLVEFHLDFTLGEPDLIRIQDRDLIHLPAAALRQVRRSQRQYVEIWVGVLLRLNRADTEADARLMAHAVFGLLTAAALVVGTPHPAGASADSGSAQPLTLAVSGPSSLVQGAQGTLEVTVGPVDSAAATGTPMSPADAASLADEGAAPAPGLLER